MIFKRKVWKKGGDGFDFMRKIANYSHISLPAMRKVRSASSGWCLRKADPEHPLPGAERGPTARTAQPLPEHVHSGAAQPGLAGTGRCNLHCPVGNDGTFDCTMAWTLLRTTGGFFVSCDRDFMFVQFPHFTIAFLYSSILLIKISRIKSNKLQYANTYL
jgi:hypothetical protein